jgi:type I site-specific restriction-modification system R (restriction) subunit
LLISCSGKSSSSDEERKAVVEKPTKSTDKNVISLPSINSSTSIQKSVEDASSKKNTYKPKVGEIKPTESESKNVATILENADNFRTKPDSTKSASKLAVEETVETSKETKDVPKLENVDSQSTDKKPTKKDLKKEKKQADFEKELISMGGKFADTLRLKDKVLTDDDHLVV